MSGDLLKEKLKLLPDSPGVYLMQNAAGEIIYVGKARILKNRVRQYFHSSPKPPKVQAMIDNIADFSYVIAPSEVDALALENNLIKKYKPKYNILLKDDKTYPYIKVHTKEDFPHLSITRKVKKDGKYFGPFMGGFSCKDILDVAAKVYRVRLCSTSIGGKNKKPCLNYHLGRCNAPCAGLCSKEDYALCVDKAISFLSGNYEEAEAVLKEKMELFAAQEEFELAMEYREKIAMLKKLQLKRITEMPRDVDADVFACSSNGLYAAVSLLVTRKGIMQGERNFPLEEGAGDKEESFLSFLIQYYSSHEFPHTIVTDEPFDDGLLSAYALEKTGKKVEIVRPKLGALRKLCDMANRNAEEYLEKSVTAIAHRNDRTRGACERLQEVLGLKHYPMRMECYDISDISGVDKVGSMVVFTNGEADKSAYRRFRVKTVEGADDFASLKEVLLRRLKKLGSDEEPRFPKPQLIIIDGGKGQLSSVKQIFDELQIDGIDLIALAKREEEIFTLDREESIRLSRRDFALQTLQRIRDEAHRFAVNYFRSVHEKRNLSSLLDGVEGIGANKKKALMDKFKTIENLRHAGKEELASTPGIGKELARRIFEYFETV